MRLIKELPNTITLGNLFCGCLAIVKAFEGDLVWAAYLVGIALVLDFLDGFTARLLKASSPIGKDLDSLADMVTFGLVPGVVMFKMISLSIDLPDTSIHVVTVVAEDSYLPYFAFIVTIFSCIRLARFNNDQRQSTSFIGLPTPANAMVVCSFPLIFQMDAGYLHRNPVPDSDSLLMNPYGLIVLSCVLSLLLIAEIPLFALKFRNFRWADNKLVYGFLLIALVLLLSLHYVAIPMIIILYILLSIVNNIFLKKKV